MLKENACLRITRLLTAAALACALFICSCKKESPPQQTGSTSETSKTTSQAGDANKPQGSAAVPAGMIAVDIKLPKPMFVGTPAPPNIENLEEARKGPRPAFYAPEGTTNVALGKPVTSSEEIPIYGELEMVTNGDKEASDGSYIELGPFVQHVTVDLGAEHNIYAVVVWHYHKQNWVFKDVIVRVAGDPDFITNVATLFNNDIDNSLGLGIGSDKHYVETNEGRLIDGRGVKGRYVRLYSNGNNANDLNYYIEVEVYGKPAE